MRNGRTMLRPRYVTEKSGDLFQCVIGLIHTKVTLKSDLHNLTRDYLTSWDVHVRCSTLPYGSSLYVDAKL